MRAVLAAVERWQSSLPVQVLALSLAPSGVAVLLLSSRPEEGALRVAAVVLVVVVAGVSAALTQRAFSRAIRPIAEVTRTIAAGDFKAAEEALRRVRLRASSAPGDPTRELTESCADMLTSLQQVAAVAGHIARGDLAAAERALGGSKALEAAAGEGEQAGRVVSSFARLLAGLGDVVSQLKSTSALLADAAVQLYSSVQDHEESIRNQAAAMDTVRESTTSLLNASENLTRSAAGLLDDAERTRETSENISKMISDLGGHIERMNGILELIDQIADRSDLLALNAALEGARAGEAGRGFSIVAREMRRLAERVTASIRDIQALIGGVQSLSASTTLATEQGRQLAETASRSAREIAQVSHEQRNGVQQVSASMDGLAGALLLSRTATQETGASTEELMRHAERLAALVGRFRVSED